MSGVLPLKTPAFVCISHDAESFEGVCRAHALLECIEYVTLSTSFFDCSRENRYLNGLRHHQDTIAITKNNVTWVDQDVTEIDWDAPTQNLAARTLILGIATSRCHGKTQVQYFRCVP